MSVVTRVAVVLLAVAAAGCGSTARRAAAPTPAPPAATHTAAHAAPAVRRCSAGERRLGTASRAYVGYAAHGAVAYRLPGRRVVARFGPRNVNDYPTLFGVIAERIGADCGVRWYRVELPIRPNGATGWVRAAAVRLATVRARIVVDVSRRRLTLYRAGRRVFSATVAVGSPATPTPVGRYYVNQRLVPDSPGGPFGPGAIGISAFSPVLTGWAQGGPVAIHGTNEPWSIGRAVSNGCIRLPNATLSRLFRIAVAGTPVIIQA
jgi:lipoprotein-anchoring transpeptidase ErfK/SrfK